MSHPPTGVYPLFSHRAAVVLLFFKDAVQPVGSRLVSMGTVQDFVKHKKPDLAYNSQPFRPGTYKSGAQLRAKYVRSSKRCLKGQLGLFPAHRCRIALSQRQEIQIGYPGPSTDYSAAAGCCAISDSQMPGIKLHAPLP
jgi:hypothetical protein